MARRGVEGLVGLPVFIDVRRLTREAGKSSASYRNESPVKAVRAQIIIILVQKDKNAFTVYAEAEKARNAGRTL